MNREQIQRKREALSDLEFSRELYVLHLGGVFTTLAIFEQTLIQSLQMPNAIKVNPGVDDGNASSIFLKKRELLLGHTLGNLIKVLEKNGTEYKDISYLKFVKEKRDFFVHRFFSELPWPGDLNHAYEFDMIARTLKYLEIIFGRATDRIPKILASNGFVELVDLGENGYLMVNEWPFGFTDEC